MAGALALAQSSGSTGQVLLWVGILIGAVITLSVVVLILRRRLLGPDRSLNNPASIMESLRAMRDRGELTPEEYERTRQAMIARATGKPITHAPPITRAAPGPARSPARDPEELRARPGYDLTGEPLPIPQPEPEPRPDKRDPPRPGHPLA